MLVGPQSTPSPRDGWADAIEEARDVAGLGFEARFELFRAACRLVFEILEHAPDREATLDYQEPLPSDSLALMERARQARPSDG